MSVGIVKMQPQVGDWVQITKSRESWNSDMDRYDGEIYKIARLDGDVATFENCSSHMSDWIWSYKCKHYRLCEPLKRKKLKLKIKF